MYRIINHYDERQGTSLSFLLPSYFFFLLRSLLFYLLLPTLQLWLLFNSCTSHRSIVQCAMQTFIYVYAKYTNTHIHSHTRMILCTIYVRRNEKKNCTKRQLLGFPSLFHYHHRHSYDYYFCCCYYVDVLMRATLHKNLYAFYAL